MPASTPLPDPADRHPLDGAAPPDIHVRRAIEALAVEIGYIAVELADVLAAPDLGAQLARLTAERDTLARDVSNLCWELADVLDSLNGNGDDSALTFLLAEFRERGTSLRVQALVLSIALQNELDRQRARDAHVSKGDV